MGNRPGCRSCRHCTLSSGLQMGWCQLRKLPIDPELAAELWCHHWTARPPRLPVMGDSPVDLLPQQGELTLALSDVFES